MPSWRRTALFLIFTLLGSFLWPLAVARADSLELKCASAILVDAETGKILYEKEARKRLPPASVTKLMTLLMAFEAVEKGKASLDDKVVASENAWDIGESEIWLEPGEEMSMYDLLMSVAVQSANDACIAIAEHLYGSSEAFVDAMNQRARELGLKDTNYVNCHGLPAKNHYTSAYDVAQIALKAQNYPELVKMTSTWEYKLRGGKSVLNNTNKMLAWYPGTQGFKTGWTTEAHYCLASMVERKETRLIAVVMGAPEASGHFNESVKLYNWGFSNFSWKPIASKGQIIKVLPIYKGAVDEVAIVASHRVGVLAGKGEDAKVTHRVVLPATLTAPLAKNHKVGEIIVYENGKESGRFPLVTRDEIKKGSLLRQIWKLFREVISFD
jgi:D-alanyl-D-alanine carboxypeptidase (penicillin-binding protein 5/6)